MGALIMLGSLFGLIALVFALVWRFDPEARTRPDAARDV
jgi:flagellar biogenesis protein FliO